MTAGETIRTLACPSCGGSINYSPGRAATTCAWCGSTVFIPAGDTAKRPFAPPDEPLPARVARLVLDGHDGAAVQLLRNELELSLQNAGKVVELVRMNQGKDAERMIHDAQEGKLR